MDEAARARAAARAAVDDITPGRLHAVIDTRIENAAMTPGVLTLLSARATDRDADPEEVDRRTAGVQLIYDGLRLTRRLARHNPWTNGEDGAEADIDILAADVLVARGFFLLAHTEAAGKAVETVRAFGRDETHRAHGRPDPELGDRTLEADVFELAIIAGVTATGADLPSGIRSFAINLAKSFDHGLPEVPELLSEPTAEALAGLVTDRDLSTTSADQAWARSSVSDP